MAGAIRFPVLIAWCAIPVVAKLVRELIGEMLVKVVVDVMEVLTAQLDFNEVFSKLRISRGRLKRKAQQPIAVAPELVGSSKQVVVACRDSFQFAVRRVLVSLNAQFV